MKITELDIKNFGKFSGRKFFFRDGMQVLYGENEFGKSTIHAFIRAMFFGLERGRGKAAQKDEFTRFEPWENPNYYAGVIRFSCGGRNFRLERSFDRFTRHVQLVCEDDGEELSVEQGDLDMLLGGMTASLYDSTVSVGQLMTQPGQSLAEALKNYAANYCETGGEIDMNGAVSMLKEKRRKCAKELKAAETRREEKQQEILHECTYLENDMDRLQKEYREREAVFRETEQRLRKIKEAGRAREEQRTEGKREENKSSHAKYLASGMAGIAVGILGVLWGGVLGSQKWMPVPLPIQLISGLILAAGVGLLGAGFFLFSKKKRQEGKGKNSQISDREVQRQEEQKRIIQEKRQIEETLSRIRWEMDRIRREWKEKEISCGNLREDSRETEEDEGIRRLTERIRALETAEEAILAASKEIGGRMSGQMNRRASEIFSEITEGKYPGLEISDRMDITVWDGERRIPAERLSRGTLEQIYFSVRMAAAELLQEEPLPLILDDTFAFYDEKRLESVLKWLSRQERQVIILSCNKREALLCENIC